MNVYDVANDLGKAMRESYEYKKLKEAKAVLDKDPDGKKMVNDFLAVSQEVQIAKMQGQEPSKEHLDKLEKLQGIIYLNKDAVEYMNYLMRFQMMLQDVTKNIQTVVDEVMGDK